LMVPGLHGVCGLDVLVWHVAMERNNTATEHVVNQRHPTVVRLVLEQRFTVGHATVANVLVS